MSPTCRPAPVATLDGGRARARGRDGRRPSRVSRVAANGRGASSRGDGVHRRGRLGPRDALSAGLRHLRAGDGEGGRGRARAIGRARQTRRGAHFPRRGDARARCDRGGVRGRGVLVLVRARPSPPPPRTPRERDTNAPTPRASRPRRPPRRPRHPPHSPPRRPRPRSRRLRRAPPNPRRGRGR